ncbi:MAG: 4-(cytidine 5'-diphospho)-2-C-methyl-D-erythritol kinase [Rhabdaerophilum sp.]
MLREFAPAKINLFLHVLGRREDGYHHLESLVSFADIGDDLSLEPHETLSLAVSGPFSFGLQGNDNLVMKAVRAFSATFGRAKSGRFHLTKNLPVASGVGGGSSDAAAALRLLAYANSIPLNDPRLLDAAKTLGADVPVCLDPSAPRMMQGIGHELGNRLHGFRYPALLVNPGMPVETKPVFEALALQPGERFNAEKLMMSESGEGGFRILESTRNDLEKPAMQKVPEIGEVLHGLRAAEGCRLARMSGSGATCFAIFGSVVSAKKAASMLHRTQPEWWAASCHIKLPS